MLGYNARMTEIAAAIGLKQLEKLDEFNARRISNAAALNPCIYMASGIAPPFVLPPNKHVFHQYTIRVTLGFKLKRDQLKQELEKRGIGCGVHYPIPIHHQPLYRELGYGDLQLMEAEKAAKEVLSLPVHPSLTQEDITKIHEAFECLRS
jgi:perosamine synthetase